MHHRPILWCHGKDSSELYSVTSSGSEQLSSVWWIRAKQILVRLPVIRALITAANAGFGIDTEYPTELLMTFTDTAHPPSVYSLLKQTLFATPGIILLPPAAGDAVAQLVWPSGCQVESIVVTSSSGQLVPCLVTWQGNIYPPPPPPPPSAVNFRGHSPSLTSQWCEIELHP